jgi:anthranilate phosphoribosyltransferase
MNPATALREVVAGQSLSTADAESVFVELLSGNVDPIQIAGLLTALTAKGIVADELTGALSAMLQFAVPVKLESPHGVIDTCGTGGDNSQSINISTMVAFVVAGAGVHVCKHGNRASSSACGSADVLEEIGANIDLDAESVAACVKEVGMGFCFAPRFHPALRELGPIRRALGIPTIFNLLGPLANPARVGRQIIGINNPSYGPMIAETLSRQDISHGLVLHGNGLDELSLSGPSIAWEVRSGSVKEITIDGTKLGLGNHDDNAIRGGDATHNAQIMHRVFEGEAGAYRDVVVLNAAAALYVAGRVNEIADGIPLAQKVLDSGEATQKLKEFVAVTQRYATASE